MTVRNLNDVQVEYISYYMYELKKCETLTMKEMDEVIRGVNRNVAIAANNLRDS